MSLYKACRLAIATGMIGSVLPCTAALADVTIERVTKFGGFMGMGAFESSETQYVSGAKSRSEATRKFTGALLGSLMPDTKTVSITRLDKDLVWEVDAKKNTYTEQSLTAAAEQMKRAQQEQAQQRGGAPETQDKPQEGEPQYKIIKNEITLTKTDETKPVAGVQARKHVLRWEVEAEDVKTKDRVTYLMLSDQWAAPEAGAVKQLKQEETAFAQAYAKKLMGDDAAVMTQQYGFAALGGIIDEASVEKFQQELAKIDGYPIATHTTWSMGGKEAEGSTQQSTEDTATPAAMPSGADAVMKSVGGMFGGLFGKKGGGESEPSASSQASAKDNTSGEQQMVLFDATTEVKSIKAGAVPAEKFELPAGVKRGG